MSCANDSQCYQSPRCAQTEVACSTVGREGTVEECNGGGCGQTVRCPIPGSTPSSYGIYYPTDTYNSCG